MSTLNRNPSIVRLAGELGLPKSGNCLKHIREFALGKVKNIIESFPVNDLDGLRLIVANRVSLKIEWIESDEDIEKICADYSDFHSALKQQLKLEFTELTTEGITLERENWDAVKHQYLAVIDARGQRRNRAYFTTWHEIVHLLVHPAQKEFPGFRRTPSMKEKNKDPLESLVDHITGHVAFYKPFYDPIITSEIEKYNGITFNSIESAKNRAAPNASLFATAIQSINYYNSPTILIKVAERFKKREERIIESSQQSFNFAKPDFTPKLRIETLIDNNSAKKKNTFEIRRNMRVPQDSVLYRLFEDPFGDQLTAIENQDWWETSSSGHLKSLVIKVEVIRRGRFVYGLITVN